MAPIELFYWPTPNGHKITIFLEETGLPYVVRPVDIGRGEQFHPDFLAISPNNRMPAIVDPDGPDGQPIAVFESAAILMYLGDKTGALYPRAPRARVAVHEWLAWQVANLGPMAGQAGHFRVYAKEKIPYAIDRYTNEVHRLSGVMNRRLADREYLAGDYSIADIASFPWARAISRYIASDAGGTAVEFPHLARWLDAIEARPAVQRGLEVGKDLGANRKPLADDPDAQKVLFGQRARYSVVRARSRRAIRPSRTPRSGCRSACGLPCRSARPWPAPATRRWWRRTAPRTSCRCRRPCRRGPRAAPPPPCRR